MYGCFRFEVFVAGSGFGCSFVLHLQQWMSRAECISHTAWAGLARLVRLQINPTILGHEEDD
jgi:hypothetical protein